MFIVISYDITDDLRRHKICKTLENYGTRVQYSVFECHLNHRQLSEVKSRLEKIAKDDEDNIRFYQICGKCLTKVQIIGNIPLSEEPYYFLV
ncbi:MAG TPA: CRISPR-associated endonuclease Cas2 [Syntrophaceae bacterium]|nr:CRISPR-associated endonuclease Cas2 [Syntrophaceae bacterium]